jgi:hypothetical protein
MKILAICAVLLVLQAVSCLADVTVTNESEEAQYEQLYQRFIRQMRDQYFTALADTNVDRSFMVNLSYMTNLDTPSFREIFRSMIVHPSFGIGWDEIPPPTMSGANSLRAVESFIATNGWYMYDNGHAFVPGINKPKSFRGLPWEVIHDREFQALTDSGILYVALQGFGPSTYGVAYNPKTNSFPRVVQLFKPLGQHWYAWVIPDMRVEGTVLRPLGSADLVKVHDSMDTPVSVGAITNADRIEKLTAFINSLPQNWNIPWYGPPGGQIYFDFYRGETNVGNFYVGPNFFGRDIYYRNGDINFYSQSATEAQIRQVTEIVGFDVWKYAQVP